MPILPMQSKVIIVLGDIKMLTSDCLGCGQECKKPCPFYNQMKLEIQKAKENQKHESR